MYNNLQLKSAPNINRVIKVAIFYCRNQNNQGPTNSTTNDDKIMNNLSNIFGPHLLTFQKVQSEYLVVSNATYLSTTNPECPNILGEFPYVKNALNIIVADSLKDNNGNLVDGLGIIGGVNAAIRTSVLSYSVSARSTISHEAGHVFGLHHTFLGTGFKEGCSNRGDFSGYSGCNTRPGCEEYVNNTFTMPSGEVNGVECGDHIPDTPADPNTWYNGVYLNLVTDPIGANYVPLANNIMSYNKASSRTNITDDQAYVCHEWAKKNADLELNAPKFMSFGDPDYTVSLVNASDFEYILPPNQACGFNPCMYEITSTNNNVSIDQNGNIHVNNSTFGIETITMNFKYFIHPLYSNYKTATATIIVNGYPGAPLIGPVYEEFCNCIISGPTLELGTDYFVHMYNADNATTFEWEFRSYNKPPITGNTVTLYFSPLFTGVHTLKARYMAFDTWSDWATQNYNVVLGLMMTISPNPTIFEMTTISLVSTSEEELDYDEGWEIEVVDMNYNKKVKEKVKGKEYKLKTHGWKAGMYIVNAKYKGKEISGKLQIE